MYKKPLVSIAHVNVDRAGIRVLENISLDIYKGDFLGIVGPNGSGKTTLLKTMLGLLPIASGSLSLFGKNIKHFRDWKKIGYVPQKPGSVLMSTPITVWEMTSLGLLHNKRFFDFQTTKDNAAITNALEAVGMEPLKNRLMHQLSGGQQQRVFIARALVSNPELLILDEPTVGVDSESQSKFYDLLRKLNKEMDLTLVLISHDIDVVSHEVSVVACINRTIISHGTPKAVLKGAVLQEMYGDKVTRIAHNHEHA